MSHVALIKLEVKDLDCLQAACKRLGLELMRDQKTFKWFGEYVGDYKGEDAAYKVIRPEDYGKCDHAIRMPGNASAYEVGLVKQASGGYLLAYDFYGQAENIAKLAGGRELNRLKQWYAAEVAAKHSKRQGWQGVRIMQTNDGRPKVVATR